MKHDKDAMEDKRDFTDEDWRAAKKQWERDHPGRSFSEIRTQSRNRLACVQMYHREYHALAKAIMTFKKGEKK